MSTAVQLKLLTLLNVSAIKRPREADQPGAQRRSLSVSPSVQPHAQSSNEPESSATGGETGEEPPRKKKRGVSFGGEVGPSGSGTKKEKASKKKDDGRSVVGNGHANGTSLASTADVSDVRDAAEAGTAPSELVAEEDTDDEGDTKNGGSTSVAGELSLRKQNDSVLTAGLNPPYSRSVQRSFCARTTDFETAGPLSSGSERVDEYKKRNKGSGKGGRTISGQVSGTQRRYI